MADKGLGKCRLFLIKSQSATLVILRSWDLCESDDNTGVGG